MTDRSLSFLIFVGRMSGVLTACASTQDVNIVSPLDANKNVKVQEQGTANVTVMNSPPAVGGTVSVGNLPLDASGAVGVTVPAVQSGTVFMVAQSVDLPANGVVFQPDPLIDTSACRSLTTFVSVAGQRASLVAPQLDLSPDAVTPFNQINMPVHVNNVWLCCGP